MLAVLSGKDCISRVCLFSHKKHSLYFKSQVSIQAQYLPRGESNITFLEHSMRESAIINEKIPPAIPAERKDLSSQYL